METALYKHSFKTPERPLASLAVYNTGLQRCQGGYCWGPGVRDHYLLHYVTAGRGTVTAPEGTHALGEGAMFLIRPDEMVSYAADTADPWAYCWVGFNGLDAGALLMRTDFTPNRRVLHFGDGETPRTLLLSIYESRGGKTHEVLRMTGRLYAFLAFLVESAADDERPRYQPGQEHVRRACQFIAGNFASPITIRDVATHAGVCRSRLYRAFQENMEISPAQYLTRFRMRQACLLLTKTDLSVKAVAFSVGFEDPLYFSRRFHEVVGCAPSEYAEREAGKAGESIDE